MLNTGDTAWILVSTALVMLMLPGLALFYGGLVRTKNVLSTFMHSFVVLGLVALQWAVYGYSLAYGPDHGGLVGGLSFGGPPGPLKLKSGETSYGSCKIGAYHRKERVRSWHIGRLAVTSDGVLAASCGLNWELPD